MEITVDLNRVIDRLTTKIATLEKELAMAYVALETATSNNQEPQLPVDLYHDC